MALEKINNISSPEEINSIAYADIAKLGGIDVVHGFVPSGTPTAWYDASQLTGLSDGDPMATFPDSGPNGYTLVQSTATLKPTYESDGASLQNGLPVIQMGYTSGYPLRFEPKAFTLTQPATIFIVFKPEEWSIGTFVLDGFTVNTILFGCRTTTPNYAIYAGSGYFCDIEISTNNWHYVTISLNGASSFIRSDGVSSAVQNAGSSSPNGLTLGGPGNLGTPPKYKLGEILVYSGTESPTANEAGLAAKWGL